MRARAERTGAASARRARRGSDRAKVTRAALELYGETAQNVHRVLLRYRLSHGRPSQRPATLIRARDRAALTAAGIRMPFGYFVGAVPPRARQIYAAAHGSSGEVLGRLGFDRLARSMHPTVFIVAKE